MHPLRHQSHINKENHMRKFALTATAAVALALSLAACSPAEKKAEDVKPKASQSQPAEKAVSLKGEFKGLNDKKVAGTVTVADGKIVLSGYSSDEGPDLHIYLTNGTDEAAVSAGKQIAAVAYDKASQTFTIDGIDASKYTDVVIHCDKVKAVFGAAALS